MAFTLGVWWRRSQCQTALAIKAKGSAEVLLQRCIPIAELLPRVWVGIDRQWPKSQSVSGLFVHSVDRQSVSKNTIKLSPVSISFAKH